MLAESDSLYTVLSRCLWRRRTLLLQSLCAIFILNADCALNATAGSLVLTGNFPASKAEVQQGLQTQSQTLMLRDDQLEATINALVARVNSLTPVGAQNSLH